MCPVFDRGSYRFTVVELLPTESGYVQAKKKGISRLRRKLGDLEVEKMESEYQIRQEVCREFHEQLTEIEETHRSVLVYVHCEPIILTLTLKTRML